MVIRKCPKLIAHVAVSHEASTICRTLLNILLWRKNIHELQMLNTYIYGYRVCVCACNWASLLGVSCARTFVWKCWFLVGGKWVSANAAALIYAVNARVLAKRAQMASHDFVMRRGAFFGGRHSVMSAGVRCECVWIYACACSTYMRNAFRWVMVSRLKVVLHVYFRKYAMN